jgi:hypothetical protein
MEVCGSVTLSLSASADTTKEKTPRNFPRSQCSHTFMRIPIRTCLAAAVCAAVMGVALAQIEASSSTYFLDIDPARYAGPAGQRFALRLGDEPRHVRLGPEDEICLQLQRSTADGNVIARVRALSPEPHDAVSVPVAGPDISPGTFRSTPWGMLLRVVSDDKARTPAKSVPAVGIANAPVCAI